MLNELDYEGKRDYNTLVEKLRNRFGSVNKSEIYRTQMKSRTRNKRETIPELAQAIKKLVRQAYPGVNKEVIEMLALDNFIDAITDSDILLRLREAGPKWLADAEQIAVSIEAYKKADKQRTRLVGREQNKDVQGKSPSQVESLSEAGQSNNRGRHIYNEQSSINQNFPRRNDNNSNNSNGAGQASAFENGNNHQGNLNLSAWGGHNSTSLDGPEKIALRSMEEGYFVPACVGNMPLTFLVDTGSNVTVLCRDLLDSWPQEHLPSLIPVNTQLVTATGECSPFYGEVEVEISLGNQKLKHQILFADIKNDGILGIDFLSANGCDVLLSKDHLMLNRERIACIRSVVDAQPICCRIALTKSIEIPPDCEIIVKGRPIDRFDKDGVGFV